MAAKALNLILFVFCVSMVVVHGRILTLNSSSDNDDDDQYLISDGVDHHDDEIRQQSTALGASTCDHQYNFLPCAENIPGYLFQILVYQGLLMFGEKQIDIGSKVLFNIIGDSKIAGVIFRILMALPSMMLMIVSGVFSSKENAQSQVSLGVGIYAGITVFSLTAHFGICVFVGRRTLKEKADDNSEASNLNCDEPSNPKCIPSKKQLIKLKDEGVIIDDETRKTAGIMLLSLIPYVTVQLVDIFRSSSANRLITLIVLIVSALSLISYFIYQIMNPWIQERSLAYSKYDILRKGFLQHVERHGQLFTQDGKINANVIHNVFAETDKDHDESITKVEAHNLVLDFIKGGNVQVEEEFAVSKVMETFDFDNSGTINENEFVDGCKKWIDEIKKSSQHSESALGDVANELVHAFKKKKKEDNPQEMNRIMSKVLMHAKTQLLKSESLITPDGKPDIDGIKSLFKKFDSDNSKSISKSEVQQIISSVEFGEFHPKYEDIVKELFKDFDTSRDSMIDESEFEVGISKWVDTAVRVAKTPDKTRSIEEYDKIIWKQAVDKLALAAALFQLLLGVLMMTFLGGPLMVSILQLSYAVGLQSFSISFVIVPLAMNARALIAAILPASQKNERSASLTFSEIYGGVIMNNIAGLTTSLAIVYAKELTWNFSAEVLTVLVVCAVIGFLAYERTTYPLWTCILAFLLYPLSLGLFYFAQVFWSWN